MRSIDCHVHLYPPETNSGPALWAQQREEHHWALLCARVRKSGAPVQGFPSVDDLLRAMDQADVERAILQGWYWEKHDTCVVQNRFFASCIARHRDRLSAVGTFHPAAGRDSVRAELEWVREQGFCGLGELSPHSQGFAIDDPIWREALKWAGEVQFPVTLHVTEPNGRGYPGRVLTPLADFVRMAQDFPETLFVLAHWGARLPLDPVLGSMAKELCNVFYDTAAAPLLYAAAVFREMVNAVGADRILFGSDYPLILFPSKEQHPEIASFFKMIEETDLRADERRKCLRENAERIFRF